MKNLIFIGCSLVIFLNARAQGLPLLKTYNYKTEVFGNDGVYAHAYEPQSHRIFIIQRNTNQLLILDISDLTKVRVVKQVSLAQGGAQPNDVAVAGNMVAVVTENNLPQAKGKVMLLDTNGNFQKQLDVGAMPRSVAFGNGGTHLLVANEGGPSDDYFSDPKGGVSVVAIFGTPPAQLTQTNVVTIDFSRWDTTQHHPDLRLFNNAGQMPSADLEPRKIAALSGSSKAVVTLGTNNGLAFIDFFSGTVDTAYGLGLKDMGVTNQGFDGGSTGAINIRPRSQIYALYNPTGVAHFKANGEDYFLTTNEGLPRDYSAFSEIQRFKNAPTSAAAFPNKNTWVEDSAIGMLEVSTELGKARNGFIHDSLVAFGARSFSVWNDSAQLIWDSGEEIEQTLAILQAPHFNSSANSNSSRKAESPKRGPQPNSVTVGSVDGVRYAFVTLKQMGGFLVYNLNNPNAPVFEQYVLDRNFSVPANDTAVGDLGPEKITFVPASQSPNGIALLMVSHAVSGSFSIYQLGQGIGLQERALNPYLSIWPNPSTGLFHTNAHQKLQIFNARGQLVQEVYQGEPINLTNAPDGFYLVQTQSGESLRILKK